jgi:uncharacterized protein YggE
MTVFASLESKFALVLQRRTISLRLRRRFRMDVRRRSKGVAAATAALAVVCLALATTTAYFGYRTFVAPSTGSSNYVGSSLLSSGNALSPLATVGQAADPVPNSILVSGSGAVSYIPNEALIRVGAVTENKSAIDATSSNAAVTSKVIKALNAAGVSNSSIQTQGYNLNVDYSNCNYSTCIPQIMGYTVTNSLLVNLTSSNPSQLGSQVGNVIDSAVGAGANQINLSFGETNSALSTLTNTALQHALATASSKAKVIASSLGVSITGVISASDSSSSGAQYYYGNAYGLSAGAAVPSISTSIIPGSQSFTVNVQVVYSIT